MNIKNFALFPLTISIISCASAYKSTTDSRLQKIYQTDNLNNVMESKQTDEVLYNVEYGTVLRLDSKYEQSNVYFSKAQSANESWIIGWQNTTVGNSLTNVSKLLINDGIDDYQLRGYERTFLPTLHAMNNFDLNNLDTTRIEVKRMYQTEEALKSYNEYLYLQTEQDFANVAKNKQESAIANQIKKQYNFPDINKPEVLALKNSYQNAFSHYLAGFVFEALNEPSLARPGYVQAGQLQPTNKIIQQSIDNLDKNIRPKPQTTDLLIVQETGHAPQIKSEEIHVPFNGGNNGGGCFYMLNIFYPKLIMDKYNQDIYSYTLDQNQLTPSPLVDVNLMALRAIKDETPHIVYRNIVAGIRNITTSQIACSTGGIGSLISIGTSLTSMFVDTADERNWNLLPAKVSINRTNLPYGKHTISINVAGNTYKKDFTLDKPYQIISYRVIGHKVFFNLQRSMMVPESNNENLPSQTR